MIYTEAYEEADRCRNGWPFIRNGGVWHTPDALYAKASAATGAERVAYLMRAAERGHAEAEYQLGLLYEYGNGVEKDIARAVEYYQKAAAQSHPQAHATLEINF